ncbi:hypothetical protein HPP92_004397 [Vanilla planifolia]|uniref:Scarecrow-like protein 23 n=1 Tax=Vanilla planifolia TaxID=51239 RepID=A0A835VKA7_VANPL|nr:hypothetical protein HPP92_004397 [Vanilla planifolia]
MENTKKRKRSDEVNDRSLVALLDRRGQLMRPGRHRPGEDKESNLVLYRLLLKCAAAVERKDATCSTEALQQLYRAVSFSGDPVQRVAAYFADGLAARCFSRGSLFLGSASADPSPAEEFSAFAALYRASPYYQFAHFTANQAIIEAFEEEEPTNEGCLHVVDLDVSHGFQWPSLIQSLSDKATGSRPISLRITGFGHSASELRETEKRLSSFAGGCRNLSFEFEAVNMVLCLHTLRNSSEISSTLLQIHALNPSVVTLVEKEGGMRAGSPHGSFLSRFVESLQYFEAMFDSLDDCLPAESKERLRIERHHLGREIKKEVEDDELRYEGLETWKSLMEGSGFEGARMSSRSVSQAKLLLKIRSHSSAMDEHGSGFRVSERDEGRAISLGWGDRRLITATSWRRA